MRVDARSVRRGRVRLRRDVSHTETEYGMVLLDERHGRYFQLTGTATTAVRALLDGGDVEAAVSALTACYDVAPATARADVHLLLVRLHGLGLVTS